MPALASDEPYVYKNGSPEVAALGNKPVLYEGTFHLSDTGDTFIDMEDWGKGIYFHQWHQYRFAIGMPALSKRFTYRAYG